MEWAYKATHTLLDHVGTMLLADRDGFLCRSAYEVTTLTWADNVRSVDLGDVLHVYYRHKNAKISALGSYVIVDPTNGHRLSGALGIRVPDTALFVVEDPSFLRRRDPQGIYQPDPVLGKLTGWALRPAGSPPRYSARLFPGMTTLQRYTGAAE